MVKNNITIEDAKIGFRNFSGKEGKFNPPGRRNFCVFVEPELAGILKEDGWNVKWMKARDPEDPDLPYLQVAVHFGKVPPRIVLVTSRGKTLLDEANVNIIDWAEIEKVDLIIRPYNWDVSGKGGVKAYVKSMYITIKEDELEAKYFDVPDSAKNSLTDD